MNLKIVLLKHHNFVTNPSHLKFSLVSLLGLMILSSCSLSGKIASLDPSRIDSITNQNSLTLKVQNSNTNQVSLDEGTLILASALLDKARKKDLDITVRISSAQGNARVQERFSSYTQSVKIPAGSTSAFISIQTTDDVIAQGADEEFTLSIFPDENSKGEISESSSFVTLIIKDNESLPTVSFQNAAQNKNEDAVSGLVNLELSQVSTNTVSVRVSAVDVTAAAGTDYSYSSQVISFSPGEVSKPVSFSLINRSGVQASRSFKFELSDVNNAVITTNATGTNTKEHAVTIIDVDQASLSLNDVTVNEGSSATVTVSLSSAYTSSVSVDYTLTAVSAVAGTDYTAASGTLTIAAGQTSATLSVSTLTNAGVCEADKTLKVVLSNPVNATIGDSEGVVTIQDITNPTVSLGASTHSVTEGSSTSLAVNLSAVCNTRNVTVEYSTTAGTATATTDYATASGATLTITAGDASGSITIPTTNDTLDENDETFTVTIASPTNASLGATTSAVVTITDNDAAPTVTLATSSSSISEGGTSVTLTATLSAASAKAVSLPFTVTGTATGTSDYTLSASSPLSIAAGATTATVTINMVEDTSLEGDETVIVSLDTPTNASLGATTSQTVTITDNDLGSFNITGVTGDSESTNDANLSNGLNPKINWDSSSGATGYKVSIVSDDASTTVCAEQTVGSVQTYQFSLTDCTLTAGTYYRARVKSTLSTLEQAATNNSYRFYVNRSPSLASNGEGPWYVMAGSSIVINAVGGSSPTIGVASDADSDAFEFTAIGTGTLGTVTTGTSSFTYAATSGTSNHGRDGITYTITDARGGTRTGTIYIHVVQATTWTGSTSNAWNTNSNWCGAVATGNRACANTGTAPTTSANRAYIDSTCTQNCSPATHASFTIGGIHMSGSTLNIQSSHTLTVSTNPIVQTGGTINISGTLYINDVGVNVTGGSWVTNTGSLVRLNTSTSNSKTLVLPASFELLNLAFTGWSNSPSRSFTISNTFKVTGSLEFAGTDVDGGIDNRLITGAINATGNITYSGYGCSTGTINIVGSANQTISGVATASVNELNINSNGGTVSLSGHLKVFGNNFTYQNGTVSAAGSTLEFYSSGSVFGSKSIDASSINFNNVIFSGGTLSNGSGKYTIINGLNIVSGDLTLSSTSSESYNRLISGTLNAHKNIIVSNSGSYEGLINIVGNTNQTISSVSGAFIPEVVINSNGGTVSFTGVFKSYANNFTHTSGVVDMGTSTFEFVAGGGTGSRTINAQSIEFYNVIFSGGTLGSGVGQFSLTGFLSVYGTLTLAGSSAAGPTYNQLAVGSINLYGNIVVNNYGTTSALNIIWLDVSASTENTYTQSVTEAYLPKGIFIVTRNYANIKLTTNMGLNSSYSGSPSLYIQAGTLDMNGYNLTAPKGITNAGTIHRQGSGASCGTITGTVTGNAATCP